MVISRVPKEGYISMENIFQVPQKKGLTKPLAGFLEGSAVRFLLECCLTCHFSSTIFGVTNQVCNHVLA